MISLLILPIVKFGVVVSILGILATLIYDIYSRSFISKRLDKQLINLSYALNIGFMLVGLSMIFNK
jgi:hypothetical protein